MITELDELVSAAFLDEHGRFAKSDEAMATVRLYFVDRTVDLTAEEYASLSKDMKVQIKNTGSGAGLIDTTHKSNA